MSVRGRRSGGGFHGKRHGPRLMGDGVGSMAHGLHGGWRLGVSRGKSGRRVARGEARREGMGGGGRASGARAACAGPAALGDGALEGLQIEVLQVLQECAAVLDGGEEVELLL